MLPALPPSADILTENSLKDASSMSLSAETNLNRDSGCGLKIQCKYLLEDDTRCADWLLQKVEKEFCKTLVAINQDRKSQ